MSATVQEKREIVGPLEQKVLEWIDVDDRDLLRAPDHLWQARTGAHEGRDWCPVCRTVRIPAPNGSGRRSYLVPGAKDWIANQPSCPPKREVYR